MGRQRTSFKRPEGKRSARLIIIAAEGRETEKIYFENLAKAYLNPKVHVEVLSRFDNNSSPENVFDQLLTFEKHYDLDDDDELWLVIDKDRWHVRTISDIAQQCVSKKCFRMALSNPAFEIWLLLHFRDVKSESVELQTQLKNNKKEKKGQDPFLKRYLRSVLGSYNEGHYDVEKMIDKVNIAIERSEELDVRPMDRWPNLLGTRVYLLAKSIKDK